MPSVSSRNSGQLQSLHNVVCVCAIIAALVLVVLGISGTALTANGWMIVAGGLTLITALMMMTIVSLLLQMHATSAQQLDALRELHERLGEQSVSLARIAEDIRISDAAKSLAHREQESDALRATILDDIRRQKWEAALKLIDEVEQRFGYKQEAESLREELEESRRAAIQTRLGQAVEMIERQFAAHDWERAQKEIDRLIHALPGEEKVLRLRDRLPHLREQHKRDLKLAWDEAVRRSDTDHAIDVLRELDQYLSAAEAQQLQDSARHVFKEKLLQLGIQFRFAVNEKRWQDALMTGLELVRDFPNARMATEVREALDTLRDRARTAASSVEPEPANR